jgi:hypothetical protein
MNVIGKSKRLLFNAWQVANALVRSIFTQSVTLHLPKGRVIKIDWPGDDGLELICVASITLPISKLRFAGQSEEGRYHQHPKYKFYKGIIDGQRAEEDPYFLNMTFESEEAGQLFLDRKLEILRAAKGGANFEITGYFLLDGTFRISDGEHRTLALVALGKSQIRLGIVLERSA